VIVDAIKIDSSRYQFSYDRAQSAGCYFFIFSFLAIGRRWVAFLALFHCVVFQTTKNFFGAADQITGKKRISGGMRPTCG
jgi:hypothetical protein